MDANLAKRIAFAVIAIPVAIGLVWLGGWPLAILLAVAGALGVREVFDLATHQGVRPLRVGGLALAAFVPLWIHAEATIGLVGPLWPLVVALLFVALLLDGLLWRKPTERPLAAVAITAFGVGYASVLPALLLVIRHGAHEGRSWAGTALVFFPLVVVWVCDSAAMFGGKAIGGPKLAPTISPGKTRSGGIAGLVGGTLVAPLFALWIFPAAGIPLPLGPALAMAVVFSVVGQLGDLVESLFKREAGVKDSSNLIPGHGGVLDRFDALYVVLPVAALCYGLAGLL